MNDPLGHQCIEQRLNITVETLKGMLKDDLEALPIQTEASFVITGLGSSEAHARYLTYLINKYTPANATFRSVADFYVTPFKSPRRETLIVFSQGLSFNSQIALNQSHLFNGSIVFTSATEAGLTHANKQDRIQFLEKASYVIHFPPEEEFDILIRILGPLAGYLAAILFINRQWPSKLPAIPKTFLSHKQPVASPPPNLELFKDGCLLLANAELMEYGCNIVYKFVEGLFVTPPHFTDYLSFCHGPFQQLAHTPKPVIILQSQGEAENDLAEKCRSMLASIDIYPWVIESPHHTPISILDHEIALNHFIFEAIKSWQIDQHNWPGKGLDQTLYAISNI